MNNQGSNGEHQTVVEFYGDLPYYVPISENYQLGPSNVDAEKYVLEIKHIKPERRLDETSGEGIDDRLGTFIKSRIHILFYPTGESPIINKETYTKKALSITNQFLLAVRDVAFDHTIRHIVVFDKFEIRAMEIEKVSGKLQPEIDISQGQHFGPFGITLLSTLSDEGMERLWLIFNDLIPINPTRQLLLDAKYHNAVGDISRAILDLATALEINVIHTLDMFKFGVPELAEVEIGNMNIYSMYDKFLFKITGHTLHERPDLFAKLEYVREVRNSIAHRWKPVFHISLDMKRKSRYLNEHQKFDGHVVETKKEIITLLDATSKIVEFVYQSFKGKYPEGG